MTEPKARPLTRVFEDMEALQAATAERIVRESARAVSERGRCVLLLTGGSTVEPVYERLAGSPWRSEIAWDALDIFFTDERCVPPDHPDSNFRMASDALLDRVPIPCERIHRMRGEDPNHERSAIDYEHRIRTALDLVRGELPRFDLVLLGLGPDAHVASLFPGDPVAEIEDRLVIAVEHHGDPPPPVDRISLTVPALNAGRATLFVVGGPAKAGAVSAVLEGPADPQIYPAQRIDPPLAPPVWLLDRPAAGHLTRQ